MSIFPLPQFEADLKEYEEARKNAASDTPDSVVVRFGRMGLIGEFPYRARTRPGCGSKLVVRTHRGTELAEMLTSTCPNAGCGKSVSRKEMLEYFDQSGGRDYPFFQDGKALRVATTEDMNTQAALDATVGDLVRAARQTVKELGLAMKIVDAEPLLGGERLTFYFMAEDRVDFRELVKRLADTHRTRIELRQIGARDEARLTAEDERCGQHCCCKQFLKVLKPVSIKSAKQQKATLDPLKISGRCGRLMCCLRYEDQTYRELKKRLPHRRSLVGTPEGPGIVVETQTLTQIVLVELDATRQRIAVPVEELCDPDAAPAPAKRDQTPPEPGTRRGPRSSPPKQPARNDARRGSADTNAAPPDAPPKKRRRRRSRRRKPGPPGPGGAPPSTPDGSPE